MVVVGVSRRKMESRFNDGNDGDESDSGAHMSLGQERMQVWVPHVIPTARREKW